MRRPTFSGSCGAPTPGGHVVATRGDGPTPLTDRLQPDVVRRVIGEVIGMDFDPGTSLSKCVGDRIAPKITIDEEDGSGRPTRRRGRARSEVPLRSPGAGAHSPRQ